MTKFSVDDVNFAPITIKSNNSRYEDPNNNNGGNNSAGGYQNRDQRFVMSDVCFCMFCEPSLWNSLCCLNANYVKRFSHIILPKTGTNSKAVELLISRL